MFMFFYVGQSGQTNIYIEKKPRKYVITNSISKLSNRKKLNCQKS